MSVYLGNMNIEDMEKRLGVSFPVELKDYMVKNHQEKATDIKPGKWHCFDIPFVIVFGDMETAKIVHDYLKPMASDFKKPIQISIQK